MSSSLIFVMISRRYALFPLYKATKFCRKTLEWRSMQGRKENPVGSHSHTNTSHHKQCGRCAFRLLWLGLLGMNVKSFLLALQFTQLVYTHPLHLSANHTHPFFVANFPLHDYFVLLVLCCSRIFKCLGVYLMKLCMEMD